MRLILVIALMWAGMAQAQTIKIEGNAVYWRDEKPDTTPVWVIYMDSVRLFSAYPEYDIRLEVAPGWRITKRNQWVDEHEWVDQSGRKFNPDNVVMDRPRKPVKNPFKE